VRTLMWFRADLRTRDNVALHEACLAAGGANGGGVVAVFTICPDQWLHEHDWADIKAEFILRNLRELSDRLGKLRIPMKIIETSRFDGVPKALLKLAKACGCDAIYFNDEYEINERRRDEAVVEAFEDAGLKVRRFTDQVVFEPGRVRTKEGKAYSVYSPFRRRWESIWHEEGMPAVRPEPQKQAETGIEPDPIPTTVRGFDMAKGREDLWPAGETHAMRRLGHFISARLDAYKDERDFPGINGTSTISPYLTAGAISPRQCFAAAYEANGEKLDKGSRGAVHWMQELVWREFYKHVLVAFPRVCKGRSFRPEYDVMPWREDQEQFQAWCEGRTGYPIVDAGMRQLAQTGWMHNRLRMIVAMFLSKHLFLDWRLGERHFMRHLIDGDLAQNNGGWQWSASTGTDAAPYFRIYNPVTQGQRFDEDGSYIRRFVPELAGVDSKSIHEPWAAGGLFDTLDYPRPIVDNKAGRERAIEAFKRQGGG